MPYGHTVFIRVVQYGLMRLRIYELLKERDITAEEMAHELGYAQSQVSRFLSGKRRAHTDFLNDTAKYLGVNVADLFEPELMPIVGYIGAGAEFHAIDDHAQGAGFDEVERPAGLDGDAVAVQVRGDSMVPAYYDGDIIFYGERQYDYVSFINRRCVCGLADGRILIKTLQRGSADNLHTLTSFNASPIEDVVVEWVSKIKLVQPR